MPSKPALPGGDAADRLKVVVTMDTKVTGWELLAPPGGGGSTPSVGRCDFVLNPPGCVDADFWIVFANARPRDEIRCAPRNTLFIAGEPAEKKIYPTAFYAQFHRIIDTHHGSGHPRVTLHAPCLSWHAGYDHQRARYVMGYDQLSSMPPPEHPRNEVSVVCSDAAFTPGQRQRLEFLKTVKAGLGDRMVHFGRGFRPVDDKLDAIYGYRFHLVLENCRVPHYWTEKIADAYLGWTFPLVMGAPNLDLYFPESSFIPIGIDAPDRAIETIRSLLAQPSDATTEREAVAAARRLILDQYNPWVAWARWAERFHDPVAEARNTVIRSHKAYRPFPRGLLYRIRN